MKKIIVTMFTLLLILASCTLRPEIDGTNGAIGGSTGSGSGATIQLIYDGSAIFTGSLLTFKWNNQASANFVRLDLFRNNHFEQMFLDYAPNAGSYAWAIPANLFLNDADLFSAKLTVYNAAANPVIIQEIQSRQFQIKQAGSSNGLSDVVVNAQTIILTMIDNGALVDGDMVRLTLNGIVIHDSLTMVGGSGTAVPVTLIVGQNTLEITALNAGSSPPNTAELLISAVISGSAVQEWRLASGETGAVKIFCQP